MFCNAHHGSQIVPSQAQHSAWQVHGSRPHGSAIGVGWLGLAKRFRPGKYIGSGENRYSAVHFDDLADLYCIALRKAHAGTILHAACENFSTKELAAAIHRGLGYEGRAVQLVTEGSPAIQPNCAQLDVEPRTFRRSSGARWGGSLLEIRS